MAEKYIRENRNSYVIVKNSKTIGKFENLDDAIFVRDILIDCGWNLDLIDETYFTDGEYVIITVMDEKVHVLKRLSDEPSADEIDRLTRNFRRNPNNSKYGLNISRVFDTFIIRKRIAGDDYIFGYYDRLEDAEFVRNFLLDNMWNVNALSQVEYDSEKNVYRVIEVIDDKAYVLGDFHDESEIDIDACREDFLTKISKHKFGLAESPHLEELKSEISNLENLWQVRVRDDNWSFENGENPLDIIFTMTPFQKAVYDAVDSSTFDEVKKSLARYRSGNFDAKVQKNLDELVGLGVIRKSQDYYEKTNF